MLDTVSNSRPPTTDTNGAASANINNQVSITPLLCPTDEPHELLCPLPIPSSPLPNYKPRSRLRFGIIDGLTTTHASPRPVRCPWQQDTPWQPDACWLSSAFGSHRQSRDVKLALRLVSKHDLHIVGPAVVA
jgi:hypothetical protein